MSGDLSVWLMTTMAVLGSLAVFLHHYREKKRREAMAQLARHLGFSFDPAPQALRKGFGQSHLFTRGHLTSVRNLLTGTQGEHDVLLFDFHYTTRSRKRRHTTRQTVAAFKIASETPAFHLRPESMLDKIGQAFGFTDIDFSSQPDFSSKYLLRGAGEAAIRQLFHTPRVRRAALLVACVLRQVRGAPRALRGPHLGPARSREVEGWAWEAAFTTICGLAPRSARRDHSVRRSKNAASASTV